MFEKINAAVEFILQQCDYRPEIGVILGSGLGNFSKKIRIAHEIPYNTIPNFPISTVEGHQGKLIFGIMAGKRIVAMSGRFHIYEGYSAQEVVFPVRVFKQLGIKLLMLSNAAGGVNPDFKVGDLMIIKDQISLSVPNPLIGKNDANFGPRFPDMSEPYSKVLIQKAKSIAKSEGIIVQEGVYYGVTGPSFETRAEYLMVYRLGADAVGMSTVQEVIAANHIGLPVFGMSVITDIGIREEENTITHEEVLEAAKAAEPLLTKIFRGIIAQF
jgi:purine-nucleoside phosphorylase